MTPNFTNPLRPALGLRLVAAAAAVLAIAVLALALAPTSASASHLPPRYFVGLSTFDPPTDWQLAKVRSANVQTMRVQLNWASVQPRRSPKLDWRRYDPVFRNAARRGVRITVTLLGVPRWVNRRQFRPPMSSTSRKNFMKFAQAATDRYGPNGYIWARKGFRGTSKAARPLYWQVWNEPNTNVYWNGRPNAASYAQLLSGTSDALNRGDSAVRVVTAGMTYPGKGQGIDARDFLRRMFRANPRIYKKFSAVGLHPYQATPSAALAGTRAMRVTMNDIGNMRRRSIYLTEIGWSSARPNGRFQVGRTGQARNLRELYDRLLGNGRYFNAAARYNINGAIWFNLQDIRDPRLKWSKTTGLLETDRDPKPSWFSLKRVTGAR